MTAPRPRTRQPKPLDAGILQAEVGSFALHLAAGKGTETIRTYTEAVRWFAAACLLQRDSRDTWEEVDSRISGSGRPGCWTRMPRLCRKRVPRSAPVPALAGHRRRPARTRR